MKDVLQFHENALAKLENFDHFVVGFSEKFPDTKCFWIVKKDGAKEDFSYVKCSKRAGMQYVS